MKKPKAATQVYALDTQKLKADGQKVGLFTDHGPSIGAFRETLLRDYLREHTPKRLSLGTGFIAEHEPGSANVRDGSSRQIDCLVHDHDAFAPLLSTTDFTVIYAVAARAIIEVKSTLKISKKRCSPQAATEGFPFKDARGQYRLDGELIGALENIKSAVDVMEGRGIDRASYFAGVFAYEGTLPALSRAVKSGDLVTQLGLTSLQQLPDIVCVLGGDCWMFGPYENASNAADAQPDDPDLSVMTSFAHPGQPGGALQSFVSMYSRRLLLDPHEAGSGGLRSAMGVNGSVVDLRFDLSSTAYRPKSESAKAAEAMLVEIGAPVKRMP